MFEYTYVVIPTVDITDDMVDESQNGPYSIRSSLDGTQSILKFATLFPKSVKGYVKYTHAEILQFLEDNKAAW